MALIANAVLSSRIANIRRNKDALRLDVQEVLVSVAYQAARGNANPANELLEAVRDTVNIKGITLWLETFAPLIVRKDAFAINKGMAKTMHVTDEASFAQYEVEMRKVNWWDMAPPQKAKSIFEAGNYLDGAFDRMAKQLNNHGKPDLANRVAELLKELHASPEWKALNEEVNA